MQHLPSMELAKRAIRSQVCTKCYQRPPGSESLEPTVMRPCETYCTMFVSLPALLPDAGKFVGMAPDEVMRRFVCQMCGSSLSAGDYCAERMTRVCPLSRYAGDLLMILETLHENEPKPKGEELS